MVMSFCCKGYYMDTMGKNAIIQEYIEQINKTKKQIGFYLKSI